MLAAGDAHSSLAPSLAVPVKYRERSHANEQPAILSVRGRQSFRRRTTSVTVQTKQEKQKERRDEDSVTLPHSRQKLEDVPVVHALDAPSPIFLQLTSTDSF